MRTTKCRTISLRGSAHVASADLGDFAKIMSNSISDKFFQQTGDTRVTATKMETKPMNPWLMSAEVAV
jgi:hypothetical protein